MRPIFPVASQALTFTVTLASEAASLDVTLFAVSTIFCQFCALVTAHAGVWDAAGPSSALTPCVSETVRLVARTCAVPLMAWPCASLTRLCQPACATCAVESSLRPAVRSIVPMVRCAVQRGAALAFCLCAPRLLCNKKFGERVGMGRTRDPKRCYFPPVDSVQIFGLRSRHKRQIS